MRGYHPFFFIILKSIKGISDFTLQLISGMKDENKRVNELLSVVLGNFSWQIFYENNFKWIRQKS